MLKKNELNMITPPFLKQGDKILLVSPAGKTTYNAIEHAIKLYEKWGLEVEISTHALDSFHTFSAKKQSRIKDFQYALDNPQVKAIFCTRGGYGSIQLIDKLDFTTFKKEPKWIVGFSDVTIFHLFLNTKLKCASLHSIVPISIKDNSSNSEVIKLYKNILFGNIPTYNISNHHLNRSGKTSGILVGGNLSTIISLIGTPYLKSLKNKILFIEDVGEEMYHLDRMLNQLKLSGILEDISALIVGGMTKMKSKAKFGKSAYEVIHSTVKEYNYPLVFNFPAGHQKKNFPLILGKKVFLEVDKRKTKLSYI